MSLHVTGHFLTDFFDEDIAFGPGADYGHVAEQDVEELGQFVEAG